MIGLNCSSDRTERTVAARSVSSIQSVFRLKSVGKGPTGVVGNDDACIRKICMIQYLCFDNRQDFARVIQT
jgi:hypothetical protein